MAAWPAHIGQPGACTLRRGSGYPLLQGTGVAGGTRRGNARVRWYWAGYQAVQVVLEGDFLDGGGTEQGTGWDRRHRLICRYYPVLPTGTTSDGLLSLCGPTCTACSTQRSLWKPSQYLVSGSRVPLSVRQARVLLGEHNAPLRGLLCVRRLTETRHATKQTLTRSR
jgi:hypothetical protein